MRESRNPVFYNGDLFSRDDIRNFRNQYPGVEAVMLGRGLLTNPSLTEETPFTAERIRAFHEDVLEGYRRAIPGDKNVLFKMKELWTYLGEAFEDSTKLMKKIRKAQKMEEYRGSSGMSSGGKAGVRPAMFSRLEETGVSAAANGGRAWL